MAGKDCIRFEVDPAIFDGNLRPTSANAAVKQERDPSFIISGSVSYPCSDHTPRLEQPINAMSDTPREQDVRHRRSRLTVCFPPKLLADLDKMANATGQSASQIVRDSIKRTLRRKRF
jgi:ribbon-helix-helix CopG family protein